MGSILSWFAAWFTAFQARLAEARAEILRQDAEDERAKAWVKQVGKSVSDLLALAGLTILFQRMWSGTWRQRGNAVFTLSRLVVRAFVNALILIPFAALIAGMIFVLCGDLLNLTAGAHVGDWYHVSGVAFLQYGMKFLTAYLHVAENALVLIRQFLTWLDEVYNGRVV
jgi:hypothetical protein